MTTQCAAEKHSPSEKQLLMCYWALVETEHLTIGHKVIMCLQLPGMSWVFSQIHQVVELGGPSSNMLLVGHGVFAISLH